MSSESDVVATVARIVGASVTSLERVDAPGSFIPNRHFRAHMADGQSVFVKEATTDWTRQILQDECHAYASIGSRGFMPKFLGHAADILVIEDLGSAHWPPPWRAIDVDLFLAALDQIGRTTAPDAVRDLDGVARCWGYVTDNPDSLLGLGFCTRGWLAEAGPALCVADSVSLRGDALVHGDFRGDNACVTDGRVVVVDWAAAARGRSDFDRIAFAIAYAAETGERPEQVAPVADPDVVAVMAGVFARHAPEPTVPPRVREQLSRQLGVALPWWARLVDLPLPATAVGPTSGLAK